MLQNPLTNTLNDAFKKNKLSMIIAGAFLLVAVVYPFVVEAILGRIPSRYFIRVGMEILFFAAMGNAWNIIGGYGRQTSWASSTFFAIGAYTSILLFVGPPGREGLQLSPLISMWLGVVLAIIVAVIIGMPCFRLRGVYFAIATIACTTIFRQLLIYFSGFTGGNLGLSFPHQPHTRAFHLIFTDFLLRPYYYIAFAWMVITTLYRAKWSFTTILALSSHNLFIWMLTVLYLLQTGAQQAIRQASCVCLCLT